MKRILMSIMMGIGLIVPAIHSAELPSFPGGDSALEKYISSNLSYPAYAKENGVEGVVTVGFTVGTDGSISNAKILKMVDPDLEKEALRLINAMPSWEPAEKDGSPIEAPAQVNVPFILE